MFKVGQLNLGIEAQHTSKFSVVSPYGNVHARFDILQIRHIYGVPLKTSQTQRISILAVPEA